MIEKMLQKKMESLKQAEKKKVKTWGERKRELRKVS